MTKPKAFMKDLQVNFVSLVDKGANKRRFAIFKSEDAGDSEELAQTLNEGGSMDTLTLGDGSEVPVQKMEDYAVSVVSSPTSFKDALTAQRTCDAIIESKWQMSEYFSLLKDVLKSIVGDGEIDNKSTALKKAINEFSDEVTSLFNGLPLEKAVAAFNETGDESMGIKKDGESGGAPVEKGAGEANFGQNKQPTGQKRTSPAYAIDGIAKKKELEDIDSKIAELQKQREETEKAISESVTDEYDDGSATNAAEATTAVDKEAPGGSLPIDGVAKEEGSEAEGSEASSAVDGEVEKATAIGNPEDDKAKEKKVAKDEEVAKGDIGTQTADAAATRGPAKQNVTLDGNIMKGFVEQFQKQLDVSLDGKLGAMRKLIKEEVRDELAELLDAKVDPVNKEVQHMRKMAGISNAGIEYLESEGAKQLAGVEKSAEAEWAAELDGTGGLRRSGRQ